LKAGIATFVVSAEGYVARSVRAELVGDVALARRVCGLPPPGQSG